MMKLKCKAEGQCGARDEKGLCVCLMETSIPCTFQKENMRVTNGHVYPYIKPEDKMMDVPVETSSLTMGSCLNTTTKQEKPWANCLRNEKERYCMNEPKTEIELTEEEIQTILEEDDRYFIEEGANAGVYD